MNCVTAVVHIDSVAIYYTNKDIFLNAKALDHIIENNKLIQAAGKKFTVLIPKTEKHIEELCKWQTYPEIGSELTIDLDSRETETKTYQGRSYTVNKFTGITVAVSNQFPIRPQK